MKRLLAYLSLMTLVTGALAQQASPQLIPFQGRLTDQQGRAYTNGQYTLLFNLYGQAVGGTPSWTERHQAVGVINGMINVFLGSITPLTNQDFSTTKYLGITIDADNNANTTDPEMVPRQMIIPAFWAKNSEKLAGYDWSAVLVGASNNPVSGKILGSKIEQQGITSTQILSNTITAGQIAIQTITSSNLSPQLALDALIPVGTVFSFAGSTVPNGWLLCDGQARSRATYSRLFDAIGTTWGVGDGSTTFNVPDLRGRVVMGAGTGVNLSPRSLGASVGSESKVLSVPEIPSHSHFSFRSEHGFVNLNSGNTPAYHGWAGDIAFPNVDFQYEMKANAATADIGLTSPTGGGQAFQIIQPSAVVNFIIKH